MEDWIWTQISFGRRVCEFRLEGLEESVGVSSRTCDRALLETRGGGLLLLRW